MHKLVTNFLDVVCPEWRGKLIGVGTDGASSMTGALKVSPRGLKMMHSMGFIEFGVAFINWIWL